MADSNIGVNRDNSIYAKIKAAIGPDGTLPEAFSIRGKSSNGMNFADGALDGMVRYQWGPSQGQDIGGLTRALVLASKEEYSKAAEAMAAYFSAGGVMLPMIDDLQQWIYDNPQSLSPEALGAFAQSYIKEGHSIEGIKFALAVLETLDVEPEGEFREIITTLAVSEEFTLFCLFIISSWSDGAQVIFDLAKRLHGWGRIHAVSMLRPQNEEMKDWMLHEGWKNDILPDYVASICIRRGGLLQVLEQDAIDCQEFKNAQSLINAGSTLGDLPSIKKYKQLGALLKAYLDHTARLASEIEDYSCVLQLKAFVEAPEVVFDEKAQIIELCNKLLNSEKCIQLAESAMEDGSDFEFARALGLPYAENAYKKLEADFDNSYDLVDLLFPDKKYVDEVISICERRLPLNDMIVDEAEELEGSDGNAQYGILSYVVQALKDTPGKGERLICCSLRSPVIGCRNIALNTLEAWRKKDVQVSSRIKELLEWLKAVEPDEGTRKRLEHF